MNGNLVLPSIAAFPLVSFNGSFFFDDFFFYFNVCYEIPGYSHWYVVMSGYAAMPR